MPIAPIDLEWASSQFPSTSAVFGSALKAQIEGFNEIVGEEEYDAEDFEVVMNVLSRDLARPHIVLLRTLSGFQEAGHAMAVPRAWLLRLEQCLAQSIAAEDGPSTYRSMMKGPDGYLQLIAELDWVAVLRGAGGVFSAHNLTGKHVDPKKDSNYDLRWQFEGRTLHGDVKWFTDWLGKTRGENLLSGQVKLLDTDLQHPVTVRTTTREWTVASVIRAAEEVLALYDAAVDQTEDARWNIETFGQVRRVSWLPAAGATLLQNVAVDLGHQLAPGEKIISIEEDEIPQDEQHGAIRSNIQKAASQLPVQPGPHGICCPVIGSALQTDDEDVEAVVIGTDESPGIFHPGSEEEGYAHTCAVICFSLNFVQLNDPPNRVQLQRSARYFSRAGQLTAEQQGFLNAIVGAYAVNTHIDTP